MNQYLLSTFSVGGEVSGAPHTPEEMQVFMERVMALEAEMDAAGAFVFGGALDDAATSTVLGPDDGEPADGPFISAKEQVAGFYIINAGSMEEAVEWGRKTAAATSHPIEVRQFRATGRVADHMPGG